MKLEPGRCRAVLECRLPRMAITGKLKSLFRRRPPTEEEIARAEAKAIEKEQLRQDRAASDSRGVVPPEVPPW